VLFAFLATSLTTLATASPAGAEPPVAPTDTAFFALPLEGFFPGETRDKKPKRINLYLVRRDGAWIAGLGTATVQGRAVWNTALMPVDPSNLRIDNDRVHGNLSVTLVPDPWVPADGKVRTATVELDVRVLPGQTPEGGASLNGTWKSSIPGTPEELEAARLTGTASGTVQGGLGGTAPNDLVDASYDLTLFDLIPGETDEPFQRRRSVSIGVREGKALSARFGQVDIRRSAYDYVPLEPPADASVTGDALAASVAFSADTLDGDAATFRVKLQGKRVANWLAGTWTAEIQIPGGEPLTRTGYFRGDVRKGAVIPETATRDDRPWFVPVKGHAAVRGGEHPRLFFRKSDLPELRRRAATPEGQAIVRRLRELLNGGDGETLPTSYNPATSAYAANKFKAVPGTYTISHAAGYGFLYQLTGDEKYAGLARECVELAWKGQRSGDDRYSWVAPGGELRAGPSLGWTAVAYDLCYDAWPEDFRRRCALAIQNYSDQLGGEWNNPEGITLRKMVFQPRQGPGSNHFGAVVGGSGLAVLAVRGDPGTDPAILDKYLAALERQIPRHLSAGWGDGGYYKEGWGASRVGTQGGFLCFLQALRVAAGRDYLNVERPNASYITMVPRSLLVLGPPGYFPYRSNMGGTYGNPEIGSADQRAGFSHGGYFSEGFGAIADRHKPALLWTYQQIFDPDGKACFDTTSTYPHRAMLALVNWPTFSGIAAKNPGEILPLAVRDTLYDHFAFRNRFRDKDDIVTTALLQQPGGTKPREIMVWGLGGLRLSFGEPPRGSKVTHYAAAADGSGTFSTAGYSLAVDYSGASGADALVVSTGGGDIKPLPENPRARLQKLDAGGVTYQVLTLSAAGTHPELTADGTALVAGKQRIELADGKLVLRTFKK